MISLFSGCGGADLGIKGGFTYLNTRYSCNPVEIVHASDINFKAVGTYNLNFENKAIVEDVNNLCFQKGDANVIIGGFPCQSFSTINPTKVPERRDNQLFWQMANIVDKVKPEVFIAENVKGFYRLSNGKYFELARNEFVKIGYNVSHKLLDASDYGVPQRRERLFIVGIREDLRKSYHFPQPIFLSRWNENLKTPLKAVIDSLIPPDDKYYFSRRAVEGVKRAKPNMKRALAQNLSSPCLTITSHLAKVSLNSRDPVLLVDPEKELYRRFTPREAARIQSFPDNFNFSGSEADAYRQIGNAVPPVVMWHVFRALSNQVFINR